MRIQSGSVVPDPAVSLTCRVADLLAGTLGAFPKFGRAPTRLSKRFDRFNPAAVGLGSGVVYLFLFCLLPVTLFRGLDLHLICLSAFGSLYLAIAVAVARATSCRVLAIIRDSLVSHLTPATLARIENSLECRFPDRTVSIRAIVVALIGTTIGGIAIAGDLKNASEIQIIWWSVGWFILFVTAARATDVARFYPAFSWHLATGEERLYAFAPSTSTPIRDLARLGRTMLIFWVAISASITLMIPILSLADVSALGASSALGAAAQFRFVRLVMPITIFFSGVFGTAVFLSNEAGLRRATDRALRRSV